MAKNSLRSAAIGLALLSLLPLELGASAKMDGGALTRLWEDRLLPQAAGLDQSLEQFLLENRALLGLKPNPSISLVQVQTQPTAIGQCFVFEQRAYGLPIFEAQLIIVASDDKMHSLFSNLSTSDFAPPAPDLTQSAALAAAQGAVGAFSLRAPEEVSLGYTPDGTLIYRALLPAQNPPADYEVWVNAQSGQILHEVDRRIFVNGIGQVFDPDPKTALECDTLHDWDDSNAAIPFAAYAVDTLFELDPDTGGYYYLVGPYVRTYQPGLRARESIPEFIYLREDDRFEEVMTYYHIDHTQRYFQNELQTPNANNRQQVCYVNGTPDDNSWYSPFSREITYGYGGVDDAEDADVIIHEYGHAVQDDINRFWNGGQTGAMGEGFGDYLAGAYSLSVNQIFQPYLVFNWDGHNQFWPGRILNAPYHYPENAWGEVHDSGQLWSAGLVDVWWDIADPVAWDRIILQHHFLLGNGALMPDAAEAILVVEANLYGGLYREVIVSDFAERGFLDPANYYPVIVHEPLPDSEDTLQTQFEVLAQITSSAPLAQSSLKLYWRPGAEPFIQENLLPTGNPHEYRGVITGPFNQQVISYYLTAADTFGLGSFAPPGAPTEVYQFYAGPDTVLPQIVWVDSLGQTYLNNGSFNVQAVVTDNVGLSQIELLWHVSSGDVQSVIMQPAAGDTFQANLSYTNAGFGQMVYYSVLAMDASTAHNTFQTEEQSFSISELAQLDDFEGPIGSWIFTGDWGLTTQFSHSSSHSIEDSPLTPYQPNSDSYAEWATPLYLSDYLHARLNFWEMSLLENQGDWGRFEVSADNGPWFPLLEVTGVNTLWTYHEIPLDAYCGGASQELRCRFRVATDDQTNLHGWFIDDLSIRVEVLVPVADPQAFAILPSKYSMGPVFPNPFNARSTIQFDLPEGGVVTLSIYDLSGRKVKVLEQGRFEAGSHRIAFDASDLSAGIYFCRLQAGDFGAVQKLVLLK